MDQHVIHTKELNKKKLITEAIVLAGGLGTRLRDSVPGLPKCMAPVAGRPFLFYVINYLRSQGINKFIFSIGYMHETIQAYLDESFPTLLYETVIENEPLGTGGAIRLALQKASTPDVIITNGDTLFKVSLSELSALHQSAGAACTLALKPMHDVDRFGIVETDSHGKITRFKEKQYYKDGLINGGTYLLSVARFMKHSFPEIFSFEQEYLEKINDGLYGSNQDGYFIDIGIPEDYARAQDEFRLPALDLKTIDQSWTLFLDRDGVINVDKPGSYIFHPIEFAFLDGGPALFKKLAEIFGRIIVVTNQRGVGRGLMKQEMLDTIHNLMRTKIEEAGGRIDQVYACTAIDDKNSLRKPNPGMAFEAKRDFPEIDFYRSIMVGNNPGDMLFGRNAGMYTVFIKTTRPDQAFPHPDIDLIYPLLADFAKAL